MDWYFVLARHTSGLGSGPGLRPRLQSGPVALVLISEWGGMASAEHVSIPWVWEHSPQHGPGTEPLVRGSGQSPIKLRAHLVVQFKGRNS